MEGSELWAGREGRKLGRNVEGRERTGRGEEGRGGDISRRSHSAGGEGRAQEGRILSEPR